ncbi:MAG: DoxX family protein [Bacteroidetes bacterium]|nr:DoxX family protein [Bacteroidota bacterium]
MKRNIDLGLLILRVGLAAMLLTHGIPKFLEFIGGNMSVVGDPIGIGGLVTTLLVMLAEFIAPVLILIGLKTRMAAILVMILMSVAALVVHAGDPFGVKEKALLYLVGFTAIALMGAGKISMDKKLGGKQRTGLLNW